VIHVEPVPKPDTFDEHVGKPGKAIVERLQKKYERFDGIPRNEINKLWKEKRRTDGNSVLDDLFDAYGGMCAYLAMYMERTAKCSVDHFVPISRDCRRAYDWSNYRLCDKQVNAKKADLDVVDPFGRIEGWFQLNLETFRVERGPKADECPQDRMERTLSILNQGKCVRMRGTYVTMYKKGKLELEDLQENAPFIAAEIRRQSNINEGDVWTDSDQ